MNYKGIKELPSFKKCCLGMVVYIFTGSTQEAEAGRSEASLVCRVFFRTVRTT